MKNTTLGRPKTFNKLEIQKLAMHHFWEFGYENSSLDDLLKAMHIKKSSFYSTFTSKEELFSSCFSIYKQESVDNLLALKRKFGAKKTMLMLTTLTLKELKETGKVKGCFLINSGKECYKKYDNLSLQVNHEFNYMQDLFVSFVSEAKELGEITNKKDAKQIAGRYINSLNGLVVTIQAGANQDLIDNLVDSLNEILE